MAYDNTNKGALWTKTAKSGLVYKSGRLNVEGKEYNISMFDNDKQGNDARPDFNIVIEPVDGNQGGNPATNNSGQIDNQAGDISVEDIPF